MVGRTGRVPTCAETATLGGVTVLPDPGSLLPARGSDGSWLDGAPPALELPADRPRPSALGAPTAHLERALSPRAVEQLTSLVERSGTDVHTVLLAVFGVLLMRTTDEQDLVLGCGPATGWVDGTASVVRSRVASDDGLLDAVRQTAAALADGVDRGARTVDQWVRDLGLEPGLSRHPLFQVGFVATAGPLNRSWPGSWSVPCDLVLAWWRRGPQVVVGLQWAPELFDRSGTERLVGHLLRLLEAGSDDDGLPVSLLPLLTDEEAAELDTWNDTAEPHDASAPLVARFCAQVGLTPDAPAVDGDGGAVTYRELSGRAVRVARVLRAHGVDSDVTVAVCAERSVDMVTGVLATLMAGGAYVPVDPAYPTGRREFLLRDCGARVVLTQRRLRHLVPADVGAEVVLLDAPHGGGDQPGQEPLRGRSGQDLGYIIYTSGSTGQPKAVAMPQSALDNLVGWQLRRPQFAPAARTLQFSALSFDVSFQEMFTTWASGGTLVLVDEPTRRDPVRLLEHLIKHRVERIFLPFVALRGLASAVASSGRPPTTLREVYTAGEQLQVDPVLRALFDALPDAVLENQYGPAEAHVVTAHTLAADVDHWPALPPIGAPIANSQVHVLDSRLQRRPVGVPGELYLGGACLARGYLGRPDLTQDRFVPAPAWTGGGSRLYRTGDLARRLPSGEVEFLGRLDAQVKFRGYRIEPGEVGAVLSGCPGVEQSIALVRVVDGGPRLTAYLVPAPGQQPDLRQVHRYAKDHLPGYMVPSHYLAVPSLPLTASGKIDTAALPDAAFDRGILQSGYQAPSSHEEHVLAGIWSVLLGIPEVGVLDDFFELGGDSLLAAEMVQRVSQELGRDMPLGALAQAPNVASLAALLREGDDGGLWRSLVPLQPGSAGTTPLFVVHGGSGNVASFPRLARALPSEQPVYGLQWDGVGRGRGQRSVERMAEHYVRELREVQPSGPVLLAGQCIGGLVAREMARQLLGDGQQVRLLVMYDSPNLDSEAYVPAARPSLRQRLISRQELRTVAYEGARWVYRRVKRDPVVLGRLAMRRAAWRHRILPLPQPVPTHFIGSGESQGDRMGLAGHWTDGALGWASCESEQFAVLRLHGDHNELLYDAAAVRLLREVLHDAHERIAEPSAP